MLRGRNLAASLLVLLLAACGAPPPPPPPFPPAARLPGINGVDLPTDASDVLGELKTSRLDFVARYYRDPTSRWPTLTAAEAQRLSALGLKIVAVWESHSGSAWYFSYASGYWDGISAYREGVAAGQPAGTAIYFAVDFNAGGAALYQVDQYFRGVNAAFAAASRGGPGYRIGVYGSGAVCDAVTRARLAQYSWLSNAHAWAGYDSYARWNIRQHGAFANLSFNHDSDEARGDYGAFRLANYAPPPMPVAEILPPQPTPAQSETSLDTLIRSLF
jgi:hypothetical protein